MLSSTRGGAPARVAHPLYHPGVLATRSIELLGRRVILRPLVAHDFERWREVRRRCQGWLEPWEPTPPPGSGDVVEDRRAFIARCGVRERERQLGTGYGFGIFIGSSTREPLRLIGEINLSSVQRGPFQNAYAGYWMDQALAGQEYAPEAVVVVLRFAFQMLELHRVQVSIIPRNASSRRVVEKLGLREEGLALRYLQIAGVWEDHLRYAITSEEWEERAPSYLHRWLLPEPASR